MQSQFAASRPRRRGFTLVELLVVIAIIGILVALLLPAVQAARESARRMQCVNHLKQMSLACHNHHDKYKTFPSGGLGPWPEIEIVNGQIAGPKEQTISWPFQILPFLEQDGIYSIPQGRPQNMVNAEIDEQIGSIIVSFYFCPSRRSPQKQELRYLMDYASATPGTRINASASADYWAGRDPFERNEDRTISYPYNGLITRTRFSLPARIEDAIDGASQTLLLGEKWLDPAKYETGAWHDDRGWTDGWDPDVTRFTAFQPQADLIGGDENGPLPFSFGGAHNGGFNAAFGDGSVKFLNFQVDLEMFNRIGGREDQLPVDLQL